jgi:hypothetical protein
VKNNLKQKRCGSSGRTQDPKFKSQYWKKKFLRYVREVLKRKSLTTARGWERVRDRLSEKMAFS